MVRSKFWACDSTLTGSPGFLINLPVEPKIIDFVSLLLTYEFFEIIFEQRNLDESRYSRSQLWVPTSPDGINKFLALYLLTRIITKPVLSQNWSTDPLLQTSVFNHVMPRKPQMNLQFIHFADNTFSDLKDSNRQVLCKVRPIFEHLADKFKSVYIPWKYISIYLSMKNC